MIELSDGREGSFMGKVLVREGDESLAVRAIQFHEPQPLPTGAHWANLGEHKMEAFAMPHGMICNHSAHGCIGSFFPSHHEYAQPPTDAARSLTFHKVPHEEPDLRQHWNHFVDKMGAWGLDVRDKRPGFMT